MELNNSIIALCPTDLPLESFQAALWLRKLRNCLTLFFEEALQFMNENSNEMIKEMRKPASQSIAKALKKLLGNASANVLMRLWLTD